MRNKYVAAVLVVGFAVSNFHTAKLVAASAWRASRVESLAQDFKKPQESLAQDFKKPQESLAQDFKKPQESLAQDFKKPQESLAQDFKKPQELVV